MAKVVARADEAHIHKDDVEKLIFHQGHLFSGAYDGTVKKWTSDLKQVAEWKAHDYPVYSMTADEKGDSIFTSSADGEIKEWDSKTGAFKQMTVMINPVSEKAADVKAIVHKVGMLYAGDMSGILRRYQKNFVKDREKHTYTEVWSVAVSPDGSKVFTARDNFVIVSDITIDIESDECANENRRRVKMQPIPFFTATDFQREEFQQTMSVASSIEGRAPIVVDENFAACVDRTGRKVKVYKNDNKNYPLLATLSEHEMILNTVHILDATRVVSSGWDGLVKLWDVQTEKELQQADLDRQYVNALAANPDEKNVVFAAGKGGMIVKIQF